MRLQQEQIDSWYAAPAGRSAANQPYAAAAVDRRDRQTETISGSSGQHTDSDRLRQRNPITKAVRECHLCRVAGNTV